MTDPTGKWEQEHLKRIDAYAGKVEQLYRGVINDIARVVPAKSVNPSAIFRFEDYPSLSGQVDLLLATLAANVNVLILSGMTSAWNLSNSKTDALVSSAFADADISADMLAPFMQRNLDALASFQSRSVNGLTLSNRIWNHTNQFRSELELGIDTALTEGTSASRLASKLKQYLNRPDGLFRRVRSKRGNLVLSRHAEAFHPGHGIYRSSYKNAERVARTEINSSYRTADYERYQQLPFVVGIRVQRSNNTSSLCDVCPSLVGAYPSNFKFVGWHPNCRCYTTTILATKEELSAMNRTLMAGGDVATFQSRNKVATVDKGYTEWIEKNRDRLLRGKSLPGFITDNPLYSSGF